MLTRTKRKVRQALSIILTLVMVLNINALAVSTEVKAADKGYDIILTRVGVYDDNGVNKVFADYYNVGTSNVDTDFEMEFYVDGEIKTTVTAESSGMAPGETRRVTSTVTVNTSKKCNITAVAKIEDDVTNNNNRTSNRSILASEPETDAPVETTTTTKAPETTTTTEAPTEAPTEEPTEAPTEAPTEEPTEEPTIGAKLSIVSIDASAANPEEGDSVNFTVQVKNEGDTVAMNVPVEVTVNGTTLTGTVTVNAGETSSVTSSLWTAVAGTYDVTAKVTLDGVVATKTTSITVSEKTPSAVTGIASPTVETNSVKLTWNASSNAQYYIIKRDGVQIATNITNLEYTDSNLSSETTYTYEIIAVNGSKQSAATSYSVTTESAYTEDPNGQPDLTITDISWSPAEPHSGDQVVFTATIKNIGNKSTTSGIKHGVRFSIDGRDTQPFTWNDQYYDSIKPGESVTLTATGGQNGNSWTATSGIHTVYAWVDDNNTNIAESDEDNNVKTEIIKVDVEEVTIPDSEKGDVSGTSVLAYPVPSGATESSDTMALSANQEDVGVFKTRVSEARSWTGNTYQPTTFTNVALFDYSGGDVEVRLKVKRTDISSVTIRPQSNGVTTSSISNDGTYTTIAFRIPDGKQGQYSLEFNGSWGYNDTVLLFAQDIQEAPTTNIWKTISSGSSSSGTLTVPEGQTLYIEGGGIHYGRVILENNAKLLGKGIVCQSNEAPWGGTNRGNPVSVGYEPVGDREGQTGETLGRHDVEINGITILDPPGWCLNIRNSYNVAVKNVNIVTARPNGDGISIQSSYNVTIDGCFVRSTDDSIVVKNYDSINSHDIKVTDTVIWTDFAQSLEIGWETNMGGASGVRDEAGGSNSDPRIYNVLYKDIDVIHSFHKAVLSIHNGDNVPIYHIAYKNINIEHKESLGDCGSMGGIIDRRIESHTAETWTTNWRDNGYIDDVWYYNINCDNISTSSGTGSNIHWDEDPGDDFLGW